MEGDTGVRMGEGGAVGAGLGGGASIGAWVEDYEQVRKL